MLEFSEIKKSFSDGSLPRTVMNMLRWDEYRLLCLVVMDKLFGNSNESISRDRVLGELGRLLPTYDSVIGDMTVIKFYDGLRKNGYIVEKESFDKKELVCEITSATTVALYVLRIVIEEVGEESVEQAEAIFEKVSALCHRIEGDRQARIDYLQKEKERIERELAALTQGGDVEVISPEKARNQFKALTRDVDRFKTDCHKLVNTYKTRFREVQKEVGKTYRGDILKKALDLMSDFDSTPEAKIIEGYRAIVFDEVRFKEFRDQVGRLLKYNGVKEYVETEGITVSSLCKELFARNREVLNWQMTFVRQLQMFTVDPNIRKNRAIYEACVDILQKAVTPGKLKLKSYDVQLPQASFGYVLTLRSEGKATVAPPVLIDTADIIVQENTRPKLKIDSASCVPLAEKYINKIGDLEYCRASLLCEGAGLDELVFLSDLGVGDVGDSNRLLESEIMENLAAAESKHSFVLGKRKFVVSGVTDFKIYKKSVDGYLDDMREGDVSIDG